MGFDVVCFCCGGGGGGGHSDIEHKFPIDLDVQHYRFKNNNCKINV